MEQDKNKSLLFLNESESVGGTFCEKSVGLLTDETVRALHSQKLYGRGRDGER